MIQVESVKMNFPFTEVDFGGDDPSAPIIPQNGSQPRASSKAKKVVQNKNQDTSQVTNSKVRLPL